MLRLFVSSQPSSIACLCYAIGSQNNIGRKFSLRNLSAIQHWLRRTANQTKNLQHGGACGFQIFFQGAILLYRKIYLRICQILWTSKYADLGNHVGEENTKTTQLFIRMLRHRCNCNYIGFLILLATVILFSIVLRLLFIAALYVLWAHVLFEGGNKI